MKEYVKQTMDAVRKYIDEEMKNAPVEKTKKSLLNLRPRSYTSSTKD